MRKANRVKKIHFVGIKGVGQTALAIIAKESGIKVQGSDIADEFITDEPLKKSGIFPMVGFSTKNINEDIDLVITTGAHGGFDNLEVIEAKKRRIRVITKGQGVGEFMEGGIFGKSFNGISVAGSHGKTTLTAIISTILKENKLDPSYIVGTGEISSLGKPGHFGKGKYFVAEADEYATEPKYDHTPQFLWQHPEIEVFTNVDFDHPDVYKNTEKVREAFLQFADQLPANGLLVCCADDEQMKLLIEKYKGKRTTYGFSASSDFNLTDVRVSGNQTFFWVKSGGMSLGNFTLNVPGEHNALNALGAIVVAQELGIPLQGIKRGLAAFTGTKRRFEFVGTLPSGAKLYDDYAHHPIEIQSTLKTFRQSFPKTRIICIFQPHTYSRTKQLFEQFSRSFGDANVAVITNIFPSQREKDDKTISSELLAQNIAKFNQNTIFLPKLGDVVEYVVKKKFGKDTIIITMGAGDVYKISDSLLKNGKVSN